MPPEPLPAPDDVACALPDANIRPRGVRRRRAVGVIMGIAAVVLLAWLLATGAPRAARLAIVPFVLWAAFGLLQAREKT